MLRILMTLLGRVLADELSAPPRPRVLVSASSDSVYEARRARQQDIEKGVQIDIHRSLINNTLEYIRNTAQVLNGVTGVLLSTYVALLVGFRKDTGFAGLGDWLWALIPAMLWMASLASAFVMAVTSSRYDLVILDLQAALETYAEVLHSRRRQLIAPAILTGCGLLAFVFLFNSVFVVPRTKTDGAAVSTPATAGPKPGGPPPQTPR